MRVGTPRALRVVAGFLAFALVVLQCVPASAAEFRVFRRTYVRASNSPPLGIDVVHVLNPGTAWRLRAVNGSLTDGSIKRMTSSTLLVNLSLILTPRNFNQRVSAVERAVKLASTNLVTNWFDGPVGAQMTVELIGQDTQPPTAVWQQPTSDLLTSASSVAVRLALADDVAGLDPASVQIRLDGASVRDQFTALTQPTLSALLDGSLTVSEGAHTLDAQAQDVAGQGTTAAVSFTVDQTPPTASLTPADGTTVDVPRPLIQAAYQDTLSGVNVASVRLILDGGDVTSQALVGAGGADFQPQADLTDGAHEVTLQVADLIGNPTAVTSRFTVETTHEPPVTPQSAFIHGMVLHALTGQPVMDAIVTVKDLEGEVLTGVDGRFAFPAPAGGAFLLTVRKEGFLPSQRHAEVLSTHDVAVEPISLTPMDPAVTVVPATGGTAVNSTGTVEVVIPDGAMAGPLPVQATEFTADEQLPGPLPTTSFFTYALDLQPDGATFSQPVTVRVRNSRGFDPGTPIPVGLYHFDTGEWLHETLGQVSADGLWVVFQTTHFSPYDCNLPPIPPVQAEAPEIPKSTLMTPPVTQPRCPTPIGSTVCPGSGDLGLEHAVPTVRTLNTARGPVLAYQSMTVETSRVLGADFTLETASASGDPGTILPASITATLQIEGQAIQAVFQAAPGLGRYAMLWDGLNARGERVPTGVYPYSLRLSHDYAGTFGTATVFGGPPLADTGVAIGTLIPMTTTLEDQVLVINQRDSPFGAGWGLQELHQVHLQPDGSALLVNGAATASHFQPGPMDDVLAINATLGSLSLFAGHGDGSFQPEVRFAAMPAGAPSLSGLAVADLNKDGRDDLVVGLLDSQQVAVRLGQGGGLFGPSLALPVGTSPTAVIAEDLNADGHADLAVANRSSNDVSILYGVGDGTFLPEQRLAAGAGPSALAAGRLNADALPEVVIANTDGDSLTVLLNGPGGFSAGPAVLAGRTPAGVVLGDFDGDTQLDVIVSNRDAGNVSFLRGQGDGTLGAPVEPALPIAQAPIGIGAADFDHDGFLDVAVAANGLAGVPVLFGQGDGTFLLPPLVVPTGSSPFALAVADLNRDGHADLIAANQVGADVAVVLGNGDRTFQARRPLKVGTEPTAVAVGEFQDDQDDPRQAFSALPGEFSVLYRNPDGTWKRRLLDGTEQHFDVEGRQTAVVDRNGNATTYAYDAAGRLASLTYPGQATFTVSYDAAGRLAGLTDAAGRTTEFQVDAAGDLRLVRNPDTTTRAFTYDADHRLTSQTDERAFTTAYHYDAFGRLQEAVLPARPVFDPSTGQVTAQQELLRVTPSETQDVINVLPPGTGTPENPSPTIQPATATVEDAQGHITEFLFDAFGAPLAVTDPLGRTTLIVRDLNGLPVKVTRPNGNAIQMTYDGRGNLTRLREQRDVFTAPQDRTFEYEPQFNQVTKATDARRDATCPTGCAAQFAYDAQGNLTQVTDALNQVTAFTYDARGLLTSVTDALGTATPAIPDDHQTLFAYDPITGNLLTTADPLDRTSDLTYDAAGNVVRSTDALLRDTLFTYDVMNRLRTVQDAELGLTEYAYDAAGNLIRVEDANDRATLFAYDSLDELTRVENPLGEARQYAYDLNRNLARLTDAKGQQVLFRYDAANQLTGKTLKDSSLAVQDTVTYAYDVLGNLTLAQDADSTLTFGYDTLGRQTSAAAGDAANPAFAQPAVTISYGYNANNDRASLSCPVCISPNYIYDAVSRLTGVTAFNVMSKSFEYDALGRLTRAAGGASARHTYTYDDASQLANLENAMLGNPIATFAYLYDPAGNRTQMTDRFGAHLFGYDRLNRLLSADHPLTSGLVDEAFTYDPVGNRLTSHLSLAHTYDVANRLLADDTFTYTYDANGNLTSKTTKALPAQTTTYTYDVENQLTRVTLPDGGVVTFRSDALGRRIEKAVNGSLTRSLYDQEDVVAMFSGLANCHTHAFLHGPGVDQPVGFFADTQVPCQPFTDGTGFRGTIVDLHPDGLGSLVALASETEGFFRTVQLRERVTYDAFGTPRFTQAGPDGLADTADDVLSDRSAFRHPYAFTGREWDAETGLYYYRARYYDPRAGRFLQEDPLGFAGGDLNVYRYVLNNPVNLVDPSGETCFSAGDDVFRQDGCAISGGGFGGGSRAPSVRGPATRGGGFGGAKGGPEGGVRSGSLPGSAGRTCPLPGGEIRPGTTSTELGQRLDSAGWIKRPASNGRGTVYTDPQSGTEVRIMTRNDGSSYARIKNANGNYLTAEGQQPSPGLSRQEAGNQTHIELGP